MNKNTYDLADEFYSMAPKYRTKERLRKMVDQLCVSNLGKLGDKDKVIILKYMKYGRYQAIIKSIGGDLILDAMKVDEMRASFSDNGVPMEFVLKMGHKEFSEKQLSKLLKKKNNGNRNRRIL